jgi:hypothetical protein
MEVQACDVSYRTLFRERLSRAEKSPKEIVMLNLIQDLQKFGFSVSDGDCAPYGADRTPASGCGMTNRGFFGPIRLKTVR